ncbi:MAG TPA: acyl-CoA dehydrogenase family protein [Kofleriaceae bacterium]|nr:acyl-CoA dehydrogenase family protein [Kofleriaceae bacterium]
MFIDLSSEERAVRDHLRAYLSELVTPAVLAEVQGTDGGGPRYTQVLKQLGRDGWLGVGWPVEYGGRARPAIEQFLFFDEVQRAGFPIPFLTLCTVGPTLMKFGTPEQRAQFLPPILRGELHFAIGYSEPGAGTDLASLTTRAVKDGDHYVINGQKVFTSLAEYADVIWLACRTDPDAPKHKGISIIMVDRNAPGVSITPIHTLGGNRTNVTYLEDVRVPITRRVGREHEGWRLITTQLNHERVALLAPGPVARFVEETAAWARETGAIATPWVQQNLARATAKIEALRLLAWRQAWNVGRDRLDPAESSTVKVFGSESFVAIYQWLLEVLGPAGALKAGSAGALLRGRIETYYRTTLVLSFGGGTNEIQRDLIAQLGLGMPRAPR